MKKTGSRIEIEPNAMQTREQAFRLVRQLQAEKKNFQLIIFSDVYNTWVGRLSLTHRPVSYSEQLLRI